MVIICLLTSFMLQEGRNAMTDNRYRWKFPIPYILGDDLGKFPFNDPSVRSECCTDCKFWWSYGPEYAQFVPLVLRLQVLRYCPKKKCLAIFEKVGRLFNNTESSKPRQTIWMKTWWVCSFAPQIWMLRAVSTRRLKCIGWSLVLTSSPTRERRHTSSLRREEGTATVCSPKTRKQVHTF